MPQHVLINRSTWQWLHGTTAVGQNTPFSLSPRNDNPGGTMGRKQPKPFTGIKGVSEGYLHLLMAIKVHHTWQPSRTIWGHFKKFLLKKKIISEVHAGIRNQQLPALAQMERNPPNNPFNTQAKH